MTKFLHSIPSFLLTRPISYPNYLKFQERARSQRKESLLFLDHTPSLTAGIGAKAENLLKSKEALSQLGVGLYSIKRGGDYTAHEPGQIVGYIHLDLKKRNLSLGEFLVALNESLVNGIQEIWNVPLISNPKSPGLYLSENPKQKLVSEGIYAKSFFTSFGFALNGTNDLRTFSLIHPCGGNFEDMTSLVKLGAIHNYPLEKSKFVETFVSRFLNRLQIL